MGCAATQAGYITSQGHFDNRLGPRGTLVLPASLQLAKVRQKEDMGSKGRLQLTSKKISTLRCTPGRIFWRFALATDALFCRLIR